MKIQNKISALFKKEKWQAGFRILLLVMVSIFLFISSAFITERGLEVENVRTLQPLISEVAKEEGMMEYLPYIKGIIMLESAGAGTDIMQSSESKYGVPNKITSQKESLEAGIAFLKQAIEKAKEMGCDIWTAIQAYNFGLSYIHYVAQHGKKNTIPLAETYSEQMLASKNAKGEHQKYRYWKLKAMKYNGGYLYRDGGNFFYAEQVAFNMKILKFFHQG